VIGARLRIVKEFQTVLFLCTGNFYRSRYAEAWFNYHACRLDLHWRAESRGFRPHLATEPLSRWAVERLDQSDISTGLTRSRPAALTAHDLAEASLVVALRESEHYPMMAETFPKWADRIRYWDVADIDEISPGVALPLIESEVERLVQQLRAGHALGANRNVLAEF